MISAFSNPDMPPLMSAESQQVMPDPKADAKKKVMGAMLQQSLSKLGKGMFQAEPMQHRPTQLDPFGNPLG